MSMNEKIPGWGIVLILVFCIGAGWVVFNKLSRMNHLPILLMCVPLIPVGRTIQSIVDRYI